MIVARFACISTETHASAQNDLESRMLRGKSTMRKS